MVSPLINLHEGLISLMDDAVASNAVKTSAEIGDAGKLFFTEDNAYAALARRPPFPIFERFVDGVQYVVNNDDWSDVSTTSSNAARYSSVTCGWAVFGSGPRQCPGRRAALLTLVAAGKALAGFTHAQHCQCPNNTGVQLIDPAQGHTCSGRHNDGSPSQSSMHCAPGQHFGVIRLYFICRTKFWSRRASRGIVSASLAGSSLLRLVLKRGD